MTPLDRAVLCVLAVSHIGMQGASQDSCRTPRNERGFCLNMNDCPLLQDILRTEENTIDMEYLHKSICGFHETDALVCCPESNTITTTSPTAPTLPNKSVCGKLGANLEQILGGSNASLGLFRWIAALGYRTTEQGKVSWHCAGSLVTDRHIITAAHCLDIKNMVLSVVRLGDLDLNDNVQDDATPTDYEVEILISHPEYKSDGLVNDISIVRLKTKVTFTDFIKPICLPTLATLHEFKTNHFTGVTSYIAGWGITNVTDLAPRTTHLQRAAVEISDHQRCQEAYRNLTNKDVVDNKMVCASQIGVDSCKGDSGGPLMMVHGENFYLYGVVSFGHKCAQPGYPGVYARTSAFMDWILQNLN